MPQIAQLIGSAGSGKTRALIEKMEKAVERLHDPHLVGFVSFTRAACDEAADRAADKFNMPQRELRHHGWFKTLHGICHRALGVGKELLTDDAEGRKWLSEALQIDARTTGEEVEAETLDVFNEAANDAQRALALWSAARNRLEGLRPVWEAAEEADTRTPDWETCRAIVERYEQAKRLDHRLDFCDLVARFAGWSCCIDGVEPIEPDGEPPRLSCYIHDEMQDSSRLLDAAFRRLIEVPTVQWVYLAADPFQSIFGWAGSDHRIFAEEYPAAKRAVMPKSWRCRKNILALGEEILSEVSDYWNRKVEPAGEGGEIESLNFRDGWAGEVDPRQEWLLLARTNFQAARIAKQLDDAGVPWVPTKKDKGSRWKSPVRNEAIKALMNLQAGAPVDGAEWQSVIKHIPTQGDGIELLTRGTKTTFRELEREDAQEQFAWVLPADLGKLGATDALRDLIAAGRWTEYVEGSTEYAEAIARWGQDAVDTPKVRLGTVHSSKGLEAENVALLTTISEPCYRAAQSEEGFDEETKVKYVAVTRARSRVLLLTEDRTRYRWRFPV